MEIQEQLKLIREFLEDKKEEERSYQNMYFDDGMTLDPLWKDSETLQSNCRARQVLCDIILNKLDRLSKTP